MLLALLVLAPLTNADAAQRLIGGALSDGHAYARLGELTDTIGPRLSGSAGAAAAVQWGLSRMKEDGLVARLEPVRAPHWVRGEERGEILASDKFVAHPLAVTALGGSVGTPEGGVTGEVIEVHSIDEARALGEKARGKIVFFNHTMSSARGYGQFVGLRFEGASAAGKVGAVAMVVRSLASASLRSPHTGAMAYEPDGPKIPAAAIAVEDAELIHRLLLRGPVRMRLGLGCRTLPEVDSANVVGEVRGREKPDEVVVLGAHLDSWDLATGAVDDGAGVAIVMEAGRLIAHLPEAPRRTVRVVLYMNEENGTAGAKAYAAAHQAELGRHVAAMEADSGAGRPLTISVRGGEGAARMLRASGLLEPLEALSVTELLEGGEGGTDIGPLAPAQVPFLSVNQDSSHYFDLHHSAADTFDKVVPQDLASSAAVFAWLAWKVADLPEALPRPPPAAPRSHTRDPEPARAPQTGAPAPAAHSGAQPQQQPPK